MELFPPGILYDFMGWKRACISMSVLFIIGAFVLLAYPGPKLGTDFRGGTEVEVAFDKPVGPGQIRAAVHGAAFSSPDVVSVDDPRNPNRYLIRVQEVSLIDE